MSGKTIALAACVDMTVVFIIVKADCQRSGGCYSNYYHQ